MTLDAQDIDRIADAVVKRLRGLPPAGDDELLTIGQVCAWLKITRTALMSYLPDWKRRGVRVVKVGKRMRFRKSQLERCAL